MLRSLVLLTLLFAAATISAQSCESTTAELTAAIDEVHALRERSASDATPVVEKHLSRVITRLAGLTAPEDAWLHLGVDLSRQLVRLDRPDDARRLLTQITSLDTESSWKETANEELTKLKP